MIFCKKRYQMQIKMCYNTSKKRKQGFEVRFL